MRTSDPALDRTLVRGIAWTGGMKWLTQFVSWAVTLVVARLLTPADYGLFGMAMVYLGLAQLASEAGLQPVVIQPKVLSDETAAQIGGLAVMMGVAVCALSAGASSAVAWFFKEERVRLLVMALSATFVLRGMQILPRGLLARDLDFRRLSLIDGAESMVAAGATVLAALFGMRYWSLVAGALCGIGVSTVMCLAMRPHRLALPRELRSVAGSLRFGGHVVGSQFAWYAYSNADFAVVGRLLGRAALGTYTFAWTIANVPVDRVTGLVQRVTAPIFAAVQDDRVKLRFYLHSLTEGLALVTLPVCVGLALVAGPLINVMLGAAWTGAIVPLRLLSIYAAVRCVTSILSQVLIFTGHARRNMQLSILAALILPVSFLIASRWGTTGVAAAWVTIYPAVIGSLYVRDTMRVVHMPVRRYAAALLPAGGATLAMAIAVESVDRAVVDHVAPPSRLALLVVTGAVVYVCYVLAVHGRRLRAVLDVLRSREAAGREPVVIGSVPEQPGVQPASRILLISWHFPPDSAVGGLRWQKLTRFAAERGWGVDVIMRDPRGLRDADPARLEDLPAGTRLWFIASRKLAFEAPLEGAVRWVRRWTRAGNHGQASSTASKPSRGSLRRSEIGLPRSVRDVARAYFSATEHLRGAVWADDATRAGVGIIEPGVHRIVVSSGPPHFVHAAARAIAEEATLPFVMDMRDPWSLVQRLPEAVASPVTTLVFSREERRAVRAASLVIMNSDSARDAMRTSYPLIATRFMSVPNGFDDDPIPDSRGQHTFIVGYAGSVYLDRDPRPLFRAAARVITTRRLDPDAFRIELMGEVASYNGVSLQQIAREEGIEEFVRTLGVRPRRAALEFLASASMLVLLPQDSDFAIPAKLFEYMQFEAWLLVLADPASATARVLEGVDADVVGPSNVEAIERALEARFAMYLSGARAQRLSRHAHLSRRSRAMTLFDAIEAIVGVPSSVDERVRMPGYEMTSVPRPASVPADTRESTGVAAALL